MTGKDRQTVADMAVEHCGISDAVFAIARHNGITVDAETAGMDLADEPVAERRAAEYIQIQRFSPANIYECDSDVLTDDSGNVTVVTETNEPIIQ